MPAIWRRCYFQALQYHFTVALSLRNHTVTPSLRLAARNWARCITFFGVVAADISRNIQQTAGVGKQQDISPAVDKIITLSPRMAPDSSGI